MIAEQPGRARECRAAFGADLQERFRTRHNLDCAAIVEHQAVIVAQVNAPPEARVRPQFRASR